MEKEVERMAMRTQKELVLLHKEGGDRPNNTLTWLNMRNWVSSHHHIQCSKRMFIRRSQYRIVSQIICFRKLSIIYVNLNKHILIKTQCVINNETLVPKCLPKKK